MGIGLENPFKEKTGYQSAIEIKSLLPLHNKVIVTEMDFSGRKLSGIRPRWAKIYAVGPEQKDVVPGQWVLVEHGRWSRGIKVIIDGEETVIRLADPECLIFVSDVPPDSDETISTSVYAERKER